MAAVYALEQTSPENYHLLAYHPTTGKAELIEVQKPQQGYELAGGAALPRVCQWCRCYL